MNREERKIFRQAVKELISLGLVENVRGRELNLKLTQKGEDLIFSEPWPAPFGLALVCAGKKKAVEMICLNRLLCHVSWRVPA
jgi:hypothetical protein